MTLDTDALVDEVPALRELLAGEKAVNQQLLGKIEVLVNQNIRMHSVLAGLKGREFADAVRKGEYKGMVKVSW